jgi:hypothetical protein
VTISNKQRCAGRSYSGTGRCGEWGPCRFAGKHYEGKKWWCGIHAPSKVAALREKLEHKRRSEEAAREQRVEDREQEEALEVNWLIDRAVRVALANAKEREAGL